MNIRSEDETPVTLFTARNAPRVLVIDPQDDARARTVAALRRTGAEVFSLATPAGATASMLGSRIEVVMIDASVDGFVDRFAAMLRQNPLLDHVALVLTASDIDGAVDELAHGFGADGLVAKSASTSALAHALRNARLRARARTAR